MAFAYNSPFDTKVFAYNCDWFKCINPFDDIEIRDIRGFVHCFVAFDDTFQEFCDKHEYYTESGNYSTTAETLFRFIKQDTDFDEEHTALADSLIELEILRYCVGLGADIKKAYKTYSSIPKKGQKVLKIEQRDKEIKMLKDLVIKDATVFQKKEGFICDMDGVIYHGNKLIPHVKEFVEWLEKNDKHYLFLTNGSGRSPRELAQKLGRMGLSVGEEHFYTSAQSTASFLASQCKGGSAYVIGEPGLT